MPRPPAADRHSLLMRAVGVWVILIAVEFVHGVLRAVFLVPVVGDSRARQIGVFTGSVLILCVAYLLVGWLRAENTKSLIIVGALWLVVTVVFEFGFGHFVFGRSWQDLGSDYNIAHGGFLAIGMLVLAFSPVIGARLRR